MYLGYPLRDSSCSLPGSIGRANLLPYLALLRTGFTMPSPLREKRWALTPPFHPYLTLKVRRYVFCGTFPRLAPAGCYPVSCPVEPGLSSAILSLRAPFSLGLLQSNILPYLSLLYSANLSIFSQNSSSL